MRSIGRATCERSIRHGCLVSSLPLLTLKHTHANSAPYKGHTRIARLAFIAEHCSALRVACADAALDQLQAETSNTVLYTALLQLRNTDPATGQPFADAARLRKQDEAWLQETSKNIKLEEEKLDLELRNYQNNQIKESVRVSAPYPARITL